MKRLRLLIYDYGDMKREWIDAEQRKEGVKGSVLRNGVIIDNIELNPLRITILQLLRLFRREANQR